MSKLWLGGVGFPAIQKLRAGAIAWDLGKFGKVGWVEIKQRCVIITMEKTHDAYQIFRKSKQREGWMKICGVWFVVDKFKENAKFGSARSRDQGRDRSSDNNCWEAENLIKKTQKERC